ncbi:MAG TPA: tetratricopeptide repeat protein [Chthoniobacterales bacterium]
MEATPETEYATADPIPEAVLIVEGDLARARLELAENDPELANPLIRAADICRQHGLSARAIPLYIEALELIDVHAFDTPGYYRIAHDIAALYDELGDLDNATYYYDAALRIADQSHGVDTIEIATILNNLALVYKKSGNPALAEAHFHRALEMYERIRGSDHPDVAAMLNNLGALYIAQGDLDMAEVMHTRALGLRQKAYGPYHPDVAESLSNLAVIHHSRQNWKKAGSFYKDALDVLTKCGQTDLDEYAIVVENYAALLRQTGKSKKAEDLEADLRAKLRR